MIGSRPGAGRWAVGNNCQWWADLTARAKQTPGYWLQAILIDLQLLRRDVWMLLCTTLRKPPVTRAGEKPQQGEKEEPK
jgi:hypothetical protein